METALQGLTSAEPGQFDLVREHIIYALQADLSMCSPFRMTLGHVYDMDLRRNETTIKEVIIQAQGEVSGSS